MSRLRHGCDDEAAYGFHSGYVGVSDVWSRVTYIDDALGVAVMTR